MVGRHDGFPRDERHPQVCLLPWYIRFLHARAQGCHREAPPPCDPVSRMRHVPNRCVTTHRHRPGCSPALTSMADRDSVYTHHIGARYPSVALPLPADRPSHDRRFAGRLAAHRGRGQRTATADHRWRTVCSPSGPLTTESVEQSWSATHRRGLVESRTASRHRPRASSCVSREALAPLARTPTTGPLSRPSGGRT